MSDSEYTTYTSIIGSQLIHVLQPTASSTAHPLVTSFLVGQLCTNPLRPLSIFILPIRSGDSPSCTSCGLILLHVELELIRHLFNAQMDRDVLLHLFTPSRSALHHFLLEETLATLPSRSDHLRRVGCVWGVHVRYCRWSVGATQSAKGRSNSGRPSRLFFSSFLLLLDISTSE